MTLKCVVTSITNKQNKEGGAATEERNVLFLINVYCLSQQHHGVQQHNVVEASAGGGCSIGAALSGAAAEPSPLTTTTLRNADMFEIHPTETAAK